MSSQIDAALNQLARAGFEQTAHVELTTPLTIGFYEEWLKEGRHGEMDYLVSHLPEKTQPTKLMGKARSAFVVTKNYVPHPEPRDLLSGLQIAAYARGRDYHHFLKGRLEAVIAQLRKQNPGEEFVSFIDSSPVLERDLARRAGLGWIGKNTCLLSKKEGSLYFIAEIYTTLRARETVMLEAVDHCGTCTRCLDACPTGALIEPRKIDARLCISYLTIESRAIAPEPLREKMGGWFFGCDICQDVCPWNIRLKRTSSDLKTNTETGSASAIQDLKWVLDSSVRALEKAVKGTALARAQGYGLKRNALIAAANLGARELRPSVEAYLTHPRLSELAEWALTRLAE